MGVKYDFSDIDDFLSDGEWEVEKAMIDVGDEVIRDAKEHHTYQNHTYNLERSNNFDVDESGLTLTNDAEYASYVEAKGYDVLSGAALKAESKLKGMFEK